MLCQHKNSKIILQIRSYSFCECTACRIIFVYENKKTLVDAKEKYFDYYRIENASRFGSGVELIVKTFRFLRAIKIFTLKPRAKSILDIGCGRGWTLYFLKKYLSFQFFN